MHLFTLLITAVFSTQFVAPNTPITIDSITPEAVSRINLDYLLPAFEVELTNVADGVEGFFSLTATGATSGVEVTVTAGDGDAYTVAAGVNMSTETPTAQTVKIYLYLREAESEDTYAIKEININAAAAWTIKVDDVDEEYYETQLAIETDMILTKEASEIWYDGMKVKFTKGDKSTAAFAVAKDFKVAAANLSALGITTADTPADVEVTLIFNETADMPGAVHTKKATLEVLQASPIFSLNKTTLTYADLAADIEFDITPPTETVDQWNQADTVKVTLTTTRLVPTEEVDPKYNVSATRVNAEKWTVTFDLSEWEHDFDAEHIYFYVHHTADEAATGNYLPTPFKVAYTGPPAQTGTFKIAPATLTYDELGSTLQDLLFTETAPTGTAWIAGLKALFVCEETDKEIEFTLTDLTTPTLFTAKLKATANLGDLEIPATGGTIKVYLSPTGTKRYIEDPMPITVTAQPVAFGIDIEEINEEDIASVTFALTPTEGAETTAWKVATTNISATFTPNNTHPPADTFTFPLTKPEGTATEFTGTAVLTTFPFNSLAEDKLIYVWAKVAANGVAAVWRPVPVTVTYVPAAAELEFDIEPVEVKADATKIESLKITPKVPAGWAGTIAFKIVDAPPTPPVHSNTEVTGTATNATTATIWSSGEVLLTNVNLTVGNTLYVYASKTNSLDDLLEVPAEIEVKAATTTTFTLNPAQVTWAADLKLEQTEIVPSPAKPAHWPKTNDTISFRISPPATPAANIDPVKGKVIVVGAGDAAKWYIPKDTDIKTLVPTEPTADVSLKVEIALEAEQWLTETTTLTVKKTGGEEPEAAMGVSPLFTLLAALVFFFVKLF